MSRRYARGWESVFFAAVCLLFGGCGRSVQPASTSPDLAVPSELKPLQGCWVMTGDDSNTFCRLSIDRYALRMACSMPEWEGVFRNNAHIRSVETDGSLRLLGSPHAWQYKLEQADGREVLELRFHFESRQRWYTVKLLRKDEAT